MHDQPCRLGGARGDCGSPGGPWPPCSPRRSSSDNMRNRLLPDIIGPGNDRFRRSGRGNAGAVARVRPRYRIRGACLPRWATGDRLGGSVTAVRAPGAWMRDKPDVEAASAARDRDRRGKARTSAAGARTTAAVDASAWRDGASSRRRSRRPRRRCRRSSPSSSDELMIRTPRSSRREGLNSPFRLFRRRFVVNNACSALRLGPPTSGLGDTAPDP
jgi:hypothetical protein